MKISDVFALLLLTTNGSCAGVPGDGKKCCPSHLQFMIEGGDGGKL